VQARFWERMDANPAARGHIAYRLEMGGAWMERSREAWCARAREMLGDGEAVRVRVEAQRMGRPDEVLAVYLAA